MIKEVTFPEIEPALQPSANQSQASDNLPRETRSGSTLGTAEIRIQGRYIVNDGTNDRVLIGRF